MFERSWLILHLIKERLDIEESIEKRIKNTNLAYIEPHKLVIGNTTYLFFNDCENVYINNLENHISLKDLQDHIKNYRSL